MRSNLIYKVVFIIITLSISELAFTQQKTVTGYVKTENTKEPVPFANISIKGTTIGVASNWDGYFSIDANIGDTILLSSIGYIPQKIVAQSHTQIPVTVYLEQNYFSLDEIKVKPNKDFSKEVLKKIQKHKKENHKEVLSTKDYKDFTKTTIYIALDSTSQSGQYFNKIGNVTVKIDDENLNYTPIYVAQEANNIENNVPTLLYNQKEAILPKLNETIESLMSQYLLVQLDLYEDQIYIFDKGFVSPLNNVGGLYYNICFSDSNIVDDKVVYNFSFYPRNKYAPLFTGEFSVNKKNYSLRQMNVYFKEEANVNFVTGFKATVAYKKQPDGKMFLSYQDVNVNLALISKKKKEDATYAADRINDVSGGNWLLNKTTVFSTSKELEKIEAAQWSQQEDIKSKEFDLQDYERISTIQQQPLIKTLDAIGGICLTGYLNLGYIDIGSVFDIYSTNAIEGHRITLPARTSEKLFKYFTLGGFVGYGTKNEEIKYGGNFGWQPFKTDKYILRMGYSDDYILVAYDKFLKYIKNNANAQGNGNLVAAITTKDRNPYLKRERTTEATFEYNADKNLAIRVSPYFTNNSASPEVRFVHEGVDYEHYNSVGAVINLRLANQHYDKLYFDRLYYFTNKPVLNIGTDIGRVLLPDFNGNHFNNYAHLRASVQGDLHFGNIIIHYMVNGGYLMGDIPYDLLDMPSGSLSLGYNKYRYSLLHQAAFAHNIYSNTFLDLNGGGVILNRIPMIRKLKWREKVSFKCHYGSLDKGYTGAFDLPDAYQHTLTYPYVEMGIGLTNIFKFLHIEYVRQIGDYYKENNLANKDGIRINAELRF